MNTRSRLITLRLIEKMSDQQSYSRALGLEDRSHYRSGSSVTGRTPEAAGIIQQTSLKTDITKEDT